MSASSFPLPEGKGTYANVAIGTASDADVSPASVAVHLKNTVDSIRADAKVPAPNFITVFFFCFRRERRPPLRVWASAWKRGGS